MEIEFKPNLLDTFRTNIKLMLPAPQWHLAALAWTIGFGVALYKGQGLVFFIPVLIVYVFSFIALIFFTSLNYIQQTRKGMAYSLNESGFTIKLASLTQTVSWDSFKRITEDDWAIYLFVDKSQAFFITKKTFQDASQATEFFENCLTHYRAALTKG